MNRFYLLHFNGVDGIYSNREQAEKALAHLRARCVDVTLTIIKAQKSRP